MANQVKVSENNNAHVPTHVRRIADALVEQARNYSFPQVFIEHLAGFQSTQFSYRDSSGQRLVVARLSHTIYPEETLVVSFEDQSNPQVVPPSDKIKNDKPITSYSTTTRHYQPRRYLGKTAGVPNSHIHATDVSRRDEANIAVDIFNFLRTGILPA